MCCVCPQVGPKAFPRVAMDLATTVERIQQNFVICDPSLPDCPIVFASDAFLELTGYPREEVLGRNCRFLQVRTWTCIRWGQTLQTVHTHHFLLPGCGLQLVWSRVITGYRATSAHLHLGIVQGRECLAGELGGGCFGRRRGSPTPDTALVEMHSCMLRASLPDLLPAAGPRHGPRHGADHP